MKLTTLEKTLLALALLLGAALLWVDTRARWDDTAVLVAAMLAGSAALGYLGPRRPMLWALAVGCWIPLWAIVQTGNYTLLPVLGFAVFGAWSGRLLRHWLTAQTA